MRRATDLIVLGAAVVIDDEMNPGQWIIHTANVGDAPREVHIAPELEPLARAWSNREKASMLSLQVQVWALQADNEGLTKKGERLDGALRALKRWVVLANARGLNCGDDEALIAKIEGGE